MSDRRKRWGLIVLSAVPVVGHSFFSAYFGLIVGVVAGVICIFIALRCFPLWGLPSSKRYAAAFALGVLASWILIHHPPSFSKDYPLFNDVVFGGLYLTIWFAVELYFGTKSLRPDSGIRNLLGEPEKGRPSERVSRAARKHG